MTGGPTHWARACTMVAIWVLSAAPAGGQQDPGSRLRASYPEAAARRIEGTIADARNDGLPTEPFYDKALEGAAKRVPPPRVEAVLNQLRQRMVQARELLGDGAAAPSLVAGADALRRGVSGEGLRRVGAGSDGRTPMALVVLGDLVEAGVPEDRAYQVVRAAMDRREPRSELLDVPATVRRLVRQGSTSPDAARRVLDALRRGDDLRRLPSDRRRPGLSDRRDRPVPPGSEPDRGRVRDGAPRR